MSPTSWVRAFARIRTSGISFTATGTRSAIFTINSSEIAMDPLTHVVVGRALVAALPDQCRLGRGAAAAAVLGALAPDADGCVALTGWDRYLRVHEIGTHSLVGASMLACATAAVVTLCLPKSRYSRLVAAAAAGTMSHVALDVASGAPIRLLWPIVYRRASLPLVAMADPWIIAICVLGLLACWPGRITMRTAARAVLGLTIGFLCLKAALLERALWISHLETASPRTTEARWGALTEWLVFDRTPEALRRWSITSRGAPARLTLSQPLRPESALVQASRSLETVRNFLAVHEFGFADQRPLPDGHTLVLWSDLRDCDAPMVCHLWFGGEFAADGHALRQLVKVGEWTQTRRAPP
jgi:membrane-bound metal-dependent hydrolase YbcI (DUF457 family)